MVQWEFCEVYWRFASFIPINPDSDYVFDDPQNEALKHQFNLTIANYGSEHLHHKIVKTVTDKFLFQNETELRQIAQTNNEQFRSIQSVAFIETNYELLYTMQEEIAHLGTQGWEIVSILRDDSEWKEYQYLLREMPYLNFRYHIKRAKTS